MHRKPSNYPFVSDRDTEGKSSLREDLLTLAPLTSMTAEHIAGVLSEQVEAFGLSWEHLVGRHRRGKHDEWLHCGCMLQQFTCTVGLTNSILP